MTRRELREQLFMLLFRKEFHTEEQMQEQLGFYNDNAYDPSADEEIIISEADLEFVTEKCRSILERLPEIDTLLTDNTEKWNISRIGKTELTILRLAIYEMLFDESIPVGVAINEAVELSKKYCQDGASSFVNGILAKFAPEEGRAEKPVESTGNGSLPDKKDGTSTNLSARKKGVFVVIKGDNSEENP